jgi:ParB-like chromosome segregation protein Spo0J
MAEKTDRSHARAHETVGESAAEWVQISQLKPWADNPRHNDGEPVRKVMESIKRFGFATPIVARKADGEVIAGHTRLKAAEALGLAMVPVRFVDLDPAEAHLLALADNRTGEAAEWDVPKLQDVMSGFGLPDIELAGWSSEDLDKMAAKLELGAGGAVGDEPESKQKTCPECGYQF